MDYRYQKDMQDDPLHIVYIMGMRIFQLKIVKMLLKLLFLLYCVLISSQFFFFVSEPSMEELIKYGPMFLQMSYATFTIFVLLDKNKLVDDAMSVIRLWAIDVAGNEVETKIRKESKRFNLYAVLNISVSLMWATSIIYPYHDEIDSFFATVIFKKWFPLHYQLLGYIVKLTSYVSCFTMIAHPFQVSYAMKHIQFQIYLFNKFVEEISKGFDDSEEDAFYSYNTESQREIEIRLKVLAKRHCSFIRWRDHTLSLMHRLIVPFCVSAFLMALCVTFLFFQITRQSSVIFIWRTISLALDVCLGVPFVIISGQALLDESDNILATFMQTDWYKWSCKNRKIMLMITTNSVRPINLKFTESVAINFELGMAIGKTVYTAASVFYGLLS